MNQAIKYFMLNFLKGYMIDTLNGINTRLSLIEDKLEKRGE